MYYLKILSKGFNSYVLFDFIGPNGKGDYNNYKPILENNSKPVTSETYQSMFPVNNQSVPSADNSEVFKSGGMLNTKFKHVFSVFKIIKTYLREKYIQVNLS